MGDRVRITMQKRPFRKGYLGDWSLEIFVIKSRLPTVPVTYQLVDLVGEPIKGKFYEQELQKVSKSDDEHFHIDRILKTRKRSDGRIEYLVSWKGYPSKFNSWVSDLVRLWRWVVSYWLYLRTVPWSLSSQHCGTVHDQTGRNVGARRSVGSWSSGNCKSFVHRKRVGRPVLLYDIF